MAQKNYTVVRNSGKTAAQFEGCERHNERENADYKNADIVKERAEMNVQFRRVFSSDGTPETYAETFKRLLAEGTIVRKGLKPDAKVFGELVFDVNTDFFEERGGYEYAKKFYEEAYRMAVKEVGSEEYILSAILHADERNKEASERLGHDVYHYHLHVIYIPVVQKEVYYQKSNKNPELAGKLKAVIPQISHSKKWPMRVPVERDGKTIILNSYSLLQDRYFEHMRATGFVGFERGERGSTAEHLEVLEFKTQKEKERAEALAAVAEEKKQAVAALDGQANKKQKQIVSLDKKLSARKKAEADISVLDSLGKKNLVGQIVLTPEELKAVQALSREGAASRGTIQELKAKVNRLARENDSLKKENDNFKKREHVKGSLREQISLNQKFIAAHERAPELLAAAIEDIMKRPLRIAGPERTEKKKQIGGEAR